MYLSIHEFSKNLHPSTKFRDYNNHSNRQLFIGTFSVISQSSLDKFIPSFFLLRSLKYWQSSYFIEHGNKALQYHLQ